MGIGEHMHERLVTGMLGGWQTDNTESDMALALNRYIGNSVLPMLIQYYSYFSNAENYASLLDATLHTVYRLSKVKILTKGQREKVSDFLVALTRCVESIVGWTKLSGKHVFSAEYGLALSRLL